MSLKSAALSVVLCVTVGPSAKSHDIYSHLVDPLGGDCCGEHDCRAVPYRITALGVQMFVFERWINIPESIITYMSIPGDDGRTGGGHWCGAVTDLADEPTLFTRCAILPPKTARAD